MESQLLCSHLIWNIIWTKRHVKIQRRWFHDTDVFTGTHFVHNQMSFTHTNPVTDTRKSQTGEWVSCYWTTLWVFPSKTWCAINFVLKCDYISLKKRTRHQLENLKRKQRDLRCLVPLLCIRKRRNATRRSVLWVEDDESNHTGRRVKVRWFRRSTGVEATPCGHPTWMLWCLACRGLDRFYHSAGCLDPCSPRAHLGRGTLLVLAPTTGRGWTLYALLHLGRQQATFVHPLLHFVDSDTVALVH